MQNFYAPTESFSENTVTLSGDEYFHATRSCRVRPGEIIAVTDGVGKRVEARITDIDAEILHAEITKDVSGIGELDTHISLALALIKPANFELAAEKCTELGVRRILPLISANTNVRPDRLKVARLEKITHAAAKQSGRSFLPEIAEPIPLLDLYSHVNGEVIVASTHAEQDMEKALKSLSDEHDLTIVIGPEGDLTDEEYDVLATAGAKSVSLGGLTLRSETAAIAAMSLAAACGAKGWKERLFG